jgi:uncharacterized OsmC-like protein
MQAKVTMRNHAVAVGQPASFDTEDAAPSAIELLLGALGAALATGLQWRLSQRSVPVHALEVVCKARSRNPMVFLGVEADGDPGLAGIEVVAYIDAHSDADVLEAVFAETMRRCPVTSTLLRGTPITAHLRTE